MTERELRECELPDLVGPWVEVIETCIREIMRYEHCLPIEIIMTKGRGRTGTIDSLIMYGPHGLGYELWLGAADSEVHFKAEPFYRPELVNSKQNSHSVKEVSNDG